MGYGLDFFFPFLSLALLPKSYTADKMKIDTVVGYPGVSTPSSMFRQADLEVTTQVMPIRGRL